MHIRVSFSLFSHLLVRLRRRQRQLLLLLRQRRIHHDFILLYTHDGGVCGRIICIARGVSHVSSHIHTHTQRTRNTLSIFFSLLSFEHIACSFRTLLSLPCVRMMSLLSLSLSLPPSPFFFMPSPALSLPLCVCASSFIHSFTHSFICLFIYLFLVELFVPVASFDVSTTAISSSIVCCLLACMCVCVYLVLPPSLLPLLPLLMVFASPLSRRHPPQ